MNRNLIIVLAGGLLIAVLVGLIVQAGVSKKTDTNTVELLVSNKNLSVGHDLIPIDVSWKSWPKDSVISGSIVRAGANQKIADVIKKAKLRRDVAAGEPILQSVLIKDAQGNVLAAAMEPGKRAVAIKVKAESMVGGFISPGDHVDVIMLYKVDVNDRNNLVIKNQVNKFAAETVLENVKVLAIDQQSKRDDEKAKVGRSVTLEVDAKGAEKVALAELMGDLSLSLRPLGDKQIDDKRTLTTDSSVSKVLQEINRLEGQTKQNSDMVRVYNGDNVQNIVVRKSAQPAPQEKPSPQPATRPAVLSPVEP